MEIPSVVETIYGEIRRLVLDGSYAPGDRLNVDELARRLNTSKTPVREALGRLESEGFLLFRPRSGWSVPSLNMEEFVSFLEMQFALRCFVSENLLDYIDRLDFDLLNDINWKLRQLLAERKYNEVIGQNDLFHITILKIHPNQVILRRLEELDGLIRLQRARFFQQEHSQFPMFARDAYTQHQNILEALRRRDPEAISGISKKHHGNIVRAYKQMSQNASAEYDQAAGDGMNRSA